MVQLHLQAQKNITVRKRATLELDLGGCKVTRKEKGFKCLMHNKEKKGEDAGL